ncbi:MAG: aminomethyltransferase [Planctomycetota bacterium]|jgi:aminomethyltransferase
MKQTSLHDLHIAHGARCVEFGGWSMPVQYGPILDEVNRVRNHAGLFDLGHMGRFRIEGPDAVALVDRVATNHCAKIPAQSIRYSLFCNEEGFPLDDLLIYREEGEGVYLVVNAGNTVRDLEFIQSYMDGFDVRVIDETAETAMLALQGPNALEVLTSLVEGYDLSSLKYYKFAFATVCGIPNVRISRTGYTGENGFEIYLPDSEGCRVWNEILEAGKDAGVQPIGLGARDTLRLEAGMALYGHEIDESHHGFEAGLDFGIALTEEKGDFVGRTALEELKSKMTRRLVGITTDGKRAPRQGYALYHGDEEVGHICSGGPSPTLGTNIGTAYVRLGLDSTGTELELDLRGKRQACTVVDLPFYSRTRKKNA